MRAVTTFPFPGLLMLTADAYLVLPAEEMRETIAMWAKDNGIDFLNVRRICSDSADSDPQAPPGCYIVSTIIRNAAGKRIRVEDETVFIKN